MVLGLSLYGHELSKFSVVVEFYEELSSDSFCEPSEDKRTLDGLGGECDTCAPRPCNAPCIEAEWLENKKFHKHLKQDSVSQLPFDDLKIVTAAMLILHWKP